MAGGVWSGLRGTGRAGGAGLGWRGVGGGSGPRTISQAVRGDASSDHPAALNGDPPQPPPPVMGRDPPGPARSIAQPLGFPRISAPFSALQNVVASPWKRGLSPAPAQPARAPLGPTQLGTAPPSDQHLQLPRGEQSAVRCMDLLLGWGSWDHATGGSSRDFGLFALQGELLSPCRCDGSVRCTHQPCLIRWISERGSWSCELCYFKYQVLAISTKNPLQWQAISLTVIEKVQIAAIILGSLFLIASISWLIWSSLSPSAKWQRQDLLFQICYGMYGFMDIVCIGLIIHEGSSVYRIFKRWQAVNQQWKVLNYDKAKDLGEPVGSGAAKAGGRNSRTNPSSGSERNPRRGQRVRTILNHHCGYTILHILSHLRPNEPRGGASSGREVVMRVTTV
uniref:RING-type E3 ubiquitin transferase n=1 Tax=Chrysemys picta bellii TaxID=8478 RepID=A0A8C3HCA5_CHRPI